jgi:hypothetical protein
MCHDAQIQHLEDNNPPTGFLWRFLKYQNQKVALDVRDKQRTFIEFLMLERYAGEEIVMRFQNVYGSTA